MKVSSVREGEGQRDRGGLWIHKVRENRYRQRLKSLGTGPDKTLAQNKRGSPSLSFFSLGLLCDKPSLSVQPRRTVSSGENMTPMCQSWS
jgi:hypothetical protein